MKYLLLLLVIVYIFSVCKSRKVISDIDCILGLLTDYLKSAKIVESGYTFIEQSLSANENYLPALNALLSKYPLIKKYYSEPFTILEYGAKDIDNYRSAQSMYNFFLMERNFALQSFEENLNPFSAIKLLFKLPSSFLNWIGVPISISFSRIFNLLSWIFAYLLGLYSDEVKFFISSILQSLIQTGK